MLYSAICQRIPSLKERDDWQLCIAAEAVVVRGPVDLVGCVGGLDGVLLRVGAGAIVLGPLCVRELRPSPTLAADHVVLVTRRYDTREEWWIRCGMSLQRRLDDLGCGDRHVTIAASEARRVHGHDVPTCRVEIHGLSDEQSLRVQAAGLGKKGKMGCGVMVPCTKAT